MLHDRRACTHTHTRVAVIDHTVHIIHAAQSFYSCRKLKVTEVIYLKRDAQKYHNILNNIIEARHHGNIHCLTVNDNRLG